MNSKEFIVRRARLWNGLSDALEPLSSFLHVREGRLIAVSPETEGASVAESELPIFDAEGRYVVPGLIDAHVHLELDPALALVEALGVDLVVILRDRQGVGSTELGDRQDTIH